MSLSRNMIAQRRAHAALVAALSVLSVGAAAQEPLVLSPKAVATEFLTAATANDWATVIRLTDGESLWEYVTAQRSAYRRWPLDVSAPSHQPTVESYMQSDSLMPRVVAEYMVAQYQRSYRKAADIPPLMAVLANVERPSQIDSLSDEEFFVRLLRAKQMPYQIGLALRISGCPMDSTLMANPTREVKGVALLTESTAVALYTEAGGMLDGRGVSGAYLQLELRRTKAGWHVLASDAVLGTGVGGLAIGTDRCRDGAAPP
jgi:hypothetical protein